MVIAHVGNSALVRLTGRLDGERSRHLADALDELLRDGLRSVVLDMSQVGYVSTAGTHVLGQRYRDFSALRGELRVSAPSPEVLAALTTAGLLDHLLLLPGDDRVAGGPGRPSAALVRASGEFTGDSWQVPTDAPHAGHYEVSRRNAGGALECRTYGRPDAFAQGYVAAECRSVGIPVQAFGLGIGAIGREFDDCRGRFGELLGVAGAVAYLPTDGALVPDYQIGAPDAPALALMGAGLVCDGSFSNLIRFRAQPGAGAVPLTEVAAMALSTSESAVAGVVIAAEATELVLASLRRSPASLGEPLEFGADSVREWLAFTAERTQSPRTAVIVGVVAREAPPALAGFLRPLGGAEGLIGHFHAMGFAYRPVPQRAVSLRALVDKLLETQPLRAVGHVVADDRGAERAGQTALLRGLCWTAPVTSVAAAA